MEDKEKQPKKENQERVYNGKNIKDVCRDCATKTFPILTLIPMCVFSTCHQAINSIFYGY